MKTQIIQIGNSQGVRIPKGLLADSKIAGEVELELHKEGILISRAQQPRVGWAEVFKSMAGNEDDEFSSDSALGEFDKKEWQW